MAVHPFIRYSSAIRLRVFIRVDDAQEAVLADAPGFRLGCRCFATPHHPRLVRPTQSAALSLLHEGRTPPLAGVGVFVRVPNARKAVLAHADLVSWLEVYDVNRHLMAIDLDSSLVYQAASLRPTGG